MTFILILQKIFQIIFLSLQILHIQFQQLFPDSATSKNLNPLYLMIISFILKNLSKIHQIALSVQKMKFPWLEYEKWYNASWYTIKPDFCKYCQILPEKMDSRSGKPDTWSRNYFVLKHIWVWMSKSWKFQTYWSNNTLNTEFFQISRKMGYQIRIYWG